MPSLVSLALIVSEI